MGLRELLLEKDAKELREKLINEGYDPNLFAEHFLDTPSARWEEEGIYNLSLKYSENILKDFIIQVQNYLRKRGDF